MKVFISWSGERSRAVAAALREWLPLVLQETRPYMSAEDIRVGSRWLPSVSQELEVAGFGVICLTPENLTAPWVNFEAGAAARSFGEGRVAPVILELRPADVTGPLSQFQACDTSREGIVELVRSINGQLANPLSEASLDRIFDGLWQQLADALAQVPSTAEDRAPRPQRDILEELLELVRNQARERVDLRAFKSIVGHERELRAALDRVAASAKELPGAESLAADIVAAEKLVRRIGFEARGGLLDVPGLDS